MNDKTEEMKQQIINETTNDKFAKMTKDTLMMGMTPTKSMKHDWIIDNEIIRYQGKVYVPENLSLQNDIIRLYHDLPHAGHPGPLRTIQLIKQDYWWPLMTTHIKRWIKGCAICQQMKINMHPT